MNTTKYHYYYSDGKIRDYNSGQPMRANYTGLVMVWDTLFRTWIEDGERCWAVAQLP